MILKETVLILGAGASMECGFPSGHGLIKEMLPRIQFWKNPVGLWRQREDSKKLMTDLGIDNASLTKLGELIESQPIRSIDALIGKRQELKNVARFIIADILIGREISGNIIRLNNRGESWYQCLWDHLSKGLDSHTHTGYNELSIITYNYDRSLDFFLRRSVKELDPLAIQSDKIARDFLTNIPIIHMHGELGKLPVEGEVGGRPYNDRKDDLQTWKIAMEGIRFIHEDYPQKELRWAMNLLGSAKNILVLGFGYHPELIKRLRLQKYTMHGTTWGLSASALNEAKTLLPNLQCHDMPIHELINQPGMLS